MSPSATQYVVVPTERGWLVRSDHADEDSERFAEKDEAIGRAFALARRSREWRVIVLGRDGSVETELYGSTDAIPMAPPSPWL
jgi:hypothetical protein